MRAINTFLTLTILVSCQMSTGSLMTRQTYDRAPRLTKLATAHISKGGWVSKYSMQGMTERYWVELLKYQSDNLLNLRIHRTRAG